jgi:hypothetical protein
MPLRDRPNRSKTVKTIAMKWIRTKTLKVQTLILLCTKRLQQMTADRNPFTPSDKEVEQARLMGMYLVHTNTKALYAAQRVVSRERHRGRHAHVRETISPFAR